MTPLEVKHLALGAAFINDKDAALKVCKAIAEEDLFIGKPFPRRQDMNTIKAWYESRCGVCGEIIQLNEEMKWAKGRGGMHPACEEK